VSSKRVFWFAAAGAFLTAALVAPTRAAEPTVRALIDLAPVLDSSAAGCRSLDVGGWWYLGERVLASKVRFRALYRAPNEFSWLVSDPADGTPLAFCAGRKMLIYDPVGPTVYYSEGAACILEMGCTRSDFKFDLRYFPAPRGERHRILVDLHSVLLVGSEPAPEAGIPVDAVARRGPSKFELDRKFPWTGHSQSFEVDLERQCPYTAATFREYGVTYLRLDTLILNDALADENFSFPAKWQLKLAVPLEDITADEGRAANLVRSDSLGRAAAVRAAITRAGPGPTKIPGLTLDWGVVRKNDTRYAKALRDLVPAKIRAR